MSWPTSDPPQRGRCAIRIPDQAPRMPNRQVSSILRAVPLQSTNEHMDYHANPNASRRFCSGMARDADSVRYAGLPLIGGKD